MRDYEDVSVFENRANDRKTLGAFYTPEQYCRKAAELVLEAVLRVPEGHDYIVLDRCAGTGNLETALQGVQDGKGDNILSHCVVSTIDPEEFKILRDRIGKKVRLVFNFDAMSREFVENPLISKYVNDANCNVILLENPPYRDASAANKTKASGSVSCRSYIFQEMSKVRASFENSNIATVRDLVNQFVWSGVRYYMKSPEDSYVLLSPVKWWKCCGIADLKMQRGFLFNRRKFNAGEGAVMCALWLNMHSDDEYLKLEAFDDDFAGYVSFGKCHRTFSWYYCKDIKGSETCVFCNDDGTESTRQNCCGKSLYSEDIIGYLTPTGFTLDPMHKNLVRMTHRNSRGTYITKQNFLFMMPLFAAKQYYGSAFYERKESCVYFSTSDGGLIYREDSDFLLSCLIYTCLSNQNKCLSFTGSDGRYYRNELCLDISNGSTAAWEYVKSVNVDNDSADLIDCWNDTFKIAKETENYNENITYGIYQIQKELNIFNIFKGKRIYIYPSLNKYLSELNEKLKSYYSKHIIEKLFKYELLK